MLHNAVRKFGTFFALPDISTHNNAVRNTVQNSPDHLLSYVPELLKCCLFEERSTVTQISAFACEVGAYMIP